MIAARRPGPAADARSDGTAPPGKSVNTKRFLRTFETHDQKTNADDEQSSNRSPTQTASITQDPSGEPRGAAVWLTADELDAIGIDVDDADAIEVHVVHGDLRLVPAGGDGSR